MLRQSDVVVLQNGYQGFISLLGNIEKDSNFYTIPIVKDGNKCAICKQIGNAVPPPLAKAIGEHIKKGYDGNEE